jgi:hypothetical protein
MVISLGTSIVIATLGIFRVKVKVVTMIVTHSLSPVGCGVDYMDLVEVVKLFFADPFTFVGIVNMTIPIDIFSPGTSVSLVRQYSATVK